MKLSHSLWPRGFTGRVILVIAVTVVAQFALASLLVEQDERALQEVDLGRRIAEQLRVADRLVTGAPPAARREAAAALSTRHFEFALAEQELPPELDGDQPESAVTRDVRASMLEWEPGLADRDIRLAEATSDGLLGPRYIVGAMDVAPGYWLTFATRDPVSDPGTILLTIFRLAVAALIVLATAALLVRTLSRPLSELSAGAARIGAQGRVRFEESGPNELRRVSHALNQMQDRIDDLIDQRTRSLAAVGHDLRTPLARLRLRLGDLPDAEDRAAARRDCAAMEQMLQDLLDFFENGAPDAPEPCDLASLCRRIVDDRLDAGTDVEFEGPPRLVARVHHAALSRAVANLVDNALRYAGSAAVALASTGEAVTISVSDDGPGIPADQMERLRLPFERLERSRRSDRGGIGLGIAIVEQAAALHEGRLVLENRTPSGLRATLVLPLVKA